MQSAAPRVLLLDGDYPTSITIAKELSEDLDATIVGAGTTRYSRLLRSRYCDVGVTMPPTSDGDYVDSLLRVVHAHRPQFVLPVGYESAATLQAVRSSLPEFVSLCLPPSESFDAGADKATTMEYATRLGIDVPTDYSALVDDLDADGRSLAGLDRLEFPVFLKARVEAGGGHSTTARVDDPARFWETYDRLETVAPTNDVLVQECITDSPRTYGCGLLFLENVPELVFGHEELRSVPRRGGSGTHLRIRRDPALEELSIDLLGEIGWHGSALVEFKRRADGRFVLMEINPKFWASYALASTSGYRFASTMVASTLDLDVDRPFGSPALTGEMVFPLRELYHYVNNRESERLLDSLATIARPGASWNVDFGDLGAWLTPPVDLVRKVPTIDPSRPTASVERNR